jgi:hypothetical protein
MVYKLTPYRNQLNLGEELSDPNVPFWSTVGASLGYTYDPLIEWIKNTQNFKDDSVDLGYSPKDDLKGYEQYGSSLLYAKNADHMKSLKRGIDENIKRREILENSSFWSQIGAAIFDPINLVTIPLGGPSLTIGKTFARGAIGVGGLQTGLEAIRYPVDPLATVSESALNIGFAAVTGGLLTSAISVPARTRTNAFNRMIDDAQKAQNEQADLDNISVMINNKTLSQAQLKKFRKKYNIKTTEDLRVEREKIAKKIDDLNIKLGEPDPEIMPVDIIGKAKAEKSKKTLTKRLTGIDNELGVRHLERKNTVSTDKYAIASGGWIGNLISTPIKRALGADNIDFAKRTMLEMASDSGILLNLHKLGMTLAPSIYQRAVIKNGEWVQVYQKTLKEWGDQIDTEAKTFLGVNTSELAVRAENLTNKPNARQTFNDFLIEANRKRTFGEEGITVPEKNAIKELDKFFTKWEVRLKATGQIGEDLNIKKLIKDSEIELQRLKNALEDLKKREPNAARYRTKFFEDKIRRKQSEISEHTLSLQAKEGTTPLGEKSFLPRYWDKNYIKKNREDFEKIIFKWYKDNPVIWSKDKNNKWNQINLSDNRDAIADRVKKTVDNILNIADGEDVPNVGAGKSKHFKHRELDIPNQLVWDYIVQDPIAIMKGYTHKVAGKYEFAKMYNGKSVEDVMDDVTEEMYAAGKTEKEALAWRKDYYHMHQRVVGSTLERSPDAWDNQVAYYLKEAAQLNYLGSAGISAIPDFAKIMMEHDWKDIIKGLQALLSDNKVTLKGNEAKLVGEAIELIQGNSHFRMVEDITNDVNASTKYDKIKNTFYLANGLAPITHLAKTLDSVIRGHSLIDMSRKLAMPEKYGKATKLEISYLARYNIDARIAAKIAATPYETTANGLILPNTLKWETSPKVDDETLTTFRTALQSGILNTVIMGTPADKPIIVDGVAYIPMSVAGKFGMPEHKIVKGYARIESGLLGLPFQFYSYALGAVNKITMSAAQGQMKNRTVGLAMSLGLGMMAVQIKTPDWAFDEMTWRDWFARGFDQSGIAALYSDMFYQSLHTGLALSGKNITGGLIQPKFPSDDAYGATIGLGGAGPSIGYDYLEALKDMIAGDFSEGAKNLIRTLPFMRLWFAKGTINEFTNNFEDWF